MGRSCRRRNSMRLLCWRYLKKPTRPSMPTMTMKTEITVITKGSALVVPATLGSSELSSSPTSTTEAFSCLGSNDCANVGVLVGMAAVLADVGLVTRGLTVTVLGAAAKDVLRTVEMGAEEFPGSTVLSSVAPTGLVPGLVSDLAAVGPRVCPPKSPG